MDSWFFNDLTGTPKNPLDIQIKQQTINLPKGCYI